jgi:dTDP-4-amino-4,6-dideoxy-D-galactose acyltransferase
MTHQFWNPVTFLNRHFDSLFPVSEQLQEVSCRRLDWDSDYFDSEIYKLEFIPENISEGDLAKALPEKKSKGKYYVFSEVPTEATAAFRLLARHGFSLVETRLTYFHLLERLPEVTRSSRPAVMEDLMPLKRVASEAVNPFDRYHSDPFFSEDEASAYLQTYIENCLKGLSEVVFVPDLESQPASFAALNKLNLPDFSIYRIPLTAALQENNGWHYHLCLAALQYAKAQQADALIMTTQSGNKAVIHNCEKLGFKLGSTFHIFSKEL